MTEMIKRGFSPATVIALLALFVALGGSVYAAKKVGGNQIKVNSIPPNRIQNDSLGSGQINESSLGKVPSATSADNATTAGSATTAASATTAESTKEIFLTSNFGGQLFSDHGFTMTLSCLFGNVDGLYLTGPDGSDLNMSGNGNFGPSANTASGTAPGVVVSAGGSDSGAAIFSGATPDGTVISGEVGYSDMPSFGGANNDCAVYGHYSIS